MTILEIVSYKGDMCLFGSTVSVHSLQQQIADIEASYDRTEDNFVELLCRRFGWTVFETEELPDFTYDRDTERLFRRK